MSTFKNLNWWRTDDSPLRFEPDDPYGFQGTLQRFQILKNHSVPQLSDFRVKSAILNSNAKYGAKKRIVGGSGLS
jgi:hypothetical protein